MAQVRRTRTERRIREALTRLLPERGIDGISVSDIAREAGINRGTFYAHYVDKYDLMNKQVDGVVEELRRIVLEPDAGEDLIPYEGVLQALRYVRDNREFVAAITGNGENARIRERMKALLGELIEGSARQRGLSLSYGGVPHDYGREMLLASTTSVLWLWISKGCVEPPEQIADLIWRGKGLSPEELLA